MVTYEAAMYAVLGLAVGSFLNLCVDRLPRGQSLISPPSHCATCQRRLGLLDLVPVLSYLLLRGRCRYCGIPLPPRVLIMEVLTGCGFLLFWWWLGPGVKLAVASLYGSLLLVIAAIDLEHHLVLNRVLYPALVVAPVTAFVYGLQWGEILLGGAVGFALPLLLYLAYSGGLGAGDVKLGAFIGIISGFPGILIALFAALVSGGAASALLLLTRKKGRRDPIPFAPFLALGAFVALIWGREMTDWYLSLF